MSQRYGYNYAVVDPAYPEEPNYWGLSAYAFGDAGKYGWTTDFAAGADETTDLLITNLHRTKNIITIAIPIMGVAPSEPVWRKGTTYDQLLIEVSHDLSVVRKLAFYHIRVLRLNKNEDSYRQHIFKHPQKIVLCQVGRDGYVKSNKKQ